MVIYNLLITAILVVAFFMCIKAYTLGLKHGKQLTNAIIPDIEINPVKPIVEHIEHKQSEKASQEQANMIDEWLHGKKVE